MCFSASPVAYDGGVGGVGDRYHPPHESDAKGEGETKDGHRVKEVPAGVLHPHLELGALKRGGELFYQGFFTSYSGNIRILPSLW